MELNINIIIPEIILIALAVCLIVLDFFITDKKKLNTIGICGLVIAGMSVLLGVKNGFALSGMIIQDNVAVFFKLLFILVGIYIFYMGRFFEDRIKGWKGEFYILIVFAIIGMEFLSSSYDFISFYVSLELLTITLYILTAYTKDNPHSVEAGLKYLITGALASGFLLYGISFIYGGTGSTGFGEIAGILRGGGHGLNGFVTIGLVLIILGLTFKISSIPFHVWTPDVYQGAPTPVTALLAAGSKAAGFVVLMRVLFTALGSVKEEWMLFIAVISAVTLIFGNMSAMPQKNIKRLIAYAGIGSAGYLLMGIASASVLGASSIMFYLLTYLFSIAGSFLVIVIFSHVSGSDEIDSYAGLSRRSPLLAATMFIGLLSLAGVPPLGGFIAKFYLFAAVVKEGLIWLAVIGILMAIVSMYYFLLVIKRIYLMEPVVEEKITLEPTTKLMLYGVNIAIIALGVYPGPFTDWFVQIARQLF